MSDMSQEDALKMISTPSPTASNSAGSSSASRRPPRKSTLTQQQKNQKRQRATQDQLVTLEMEFNKNPTPTATVRERIAEDINMTERSVQIWFQNRRAKIKLIAKKSIETGESCEIPEAMRQYLAIQEMESGKSLGGNFLGRGGLMPYGSGNMLMGGDQGPQGKVVIHHLSCRSLSIGSWRRIGQNAMDLIIFYSPDKSTMTYYINNDQAGYKIEYPFSSIKNIYLENGDNESRPGGLVVELIRAPNFFMDSSGSGGFYQCGDFTEDQQASQVMVHHLGGHPKVLSGQLAKLVSLESFIARDSPFAHQQPLSISAPVSPTGHRPSSQPNFNAQPHVVRVDRVTEDKRSRSVPMAVDFSMFNNPMPSFLIQHPGESQHQQQQQQQQHPNPNIFAPIPQQPNNLGPLGPNLRIDTSSGYGMDFRQYPMSAATTTSPSDYASPGFFPHANDNGPMTGPMPTSTSMPASSFAPYSMPYLSPDPSSLVPPSVSPLSFMSHGDPAIVDQSPPMSMMHRSASADVYSMHNDSAISDDGTGLNEMYQKHTLNIPMHPHSPAFGEQSAADIDMSNLVQFPVDHDGLPHDGLSPEHMPQ
ncbi:hypothetical protein EYC84_007846 [Monilinia fructicola]|uniref:Homeobox domain-containing protein n=1 Tax=Monilinia fructicola TaxID=38448 RepID=A0A5M9JJF4_MONFR|nr:hypothetical protein EYC84_007846 [Monilinia fructicola]